MRVRTQMQEGKFIFINNKQNKKNYPVGEKQSGWTRQGRAGQDTRHTQNTTTNQPGIAKTRRY